MHECTLLSMALCSSEKLKSEVHQPSKRSGSLATWGFNPSVNDRIGVSANGAIAPRDPVDVPLQLGTARYRSDPWIDDIS